MTKRTTNRIGIALGIAVLLGTLSVRIWAESTSTPVTTPKIGAPFLTIAVNYRLSIDLACPTGYVPVAATCGGSAVLNYQTPGPLNPSAKWVNYLTTNGVHCDTGSAYSYSQVFLRCSRQY